MVELLKFPSIENTYDTKNIDFWLRNNPEVQDMDYLITSKIDGSNFSIIITDSEVKYASRNRIIEEGDNFFNYKDVVKRYERDILKFQNHVKKMGITSIQISCELFGDNIFKRVKYFPETRLRMLSIAVDGRWLSPSAQMLLITHVGLNGLDSKGNNDETFYESLAFRPTLAKIKGLKNALDYSCIHKSLINRSIEGENEEEGIVIQPYNKVVKFVNSDGQEKMFILKSKSPNFTDKMKIKNVDKNKNSTDSILTLALREYITESRVVSAFSKYGKMESFSDIPKYLKIISDDIFNDYNNENDLKINEKEFKDAMKRNSSLIIKLLKGVE